MSNVRVRRVGEPLPQGHVCKCYSCSGGSFPPDEALPLAASAHGHFRVDSFPLCERVEIDGEPTLYVIECQEGDREPWALMICEPIHRCEACGSGRPCMRFIFPKRITVTVHEAQRELFEQVKARALARGE